jgi:hypothetical protein
MNGYEVHGRSTARNQRIRALAALVMVATLGLGLAAQAQSARPNPGAWKGAKVAFHVKRGSGGLRVVRFRTTYTLGCQTPASGGRQHRIARLSFRISRRGRFGGSRRLPLKGSNRTFTARVSGRFIGRRQARGTINWIFPGCRPTRRKWSATGPIVWPNSGGDNVGDDFCIWIPLADGSGFICV